MLQQSHGNGIDVLQCEVYGEIGEVITGQKQAFWEKTTVFKSVGKCS
jgi:hypothetical protein